jgi:hypothetical protein
MKLIMYANFELVHIDKMTKLVCGIQEDDNWIDFGYLKWEFKDPKERDRVFKKITQTLVKEGVLLDCTPKPSIPVEVSNIDRTRRR